MLQSSSTLAQLAIHVAMLKRTWLNSHPLPAVKGRGHSRNTIATNLTKYSFPIFIFYARQEKKKIPTCT